VVGRALTHVRRPTPSPVGCDISAADGAEPMSAPSPILSPAAVHLSMPGGVADGRPRLPRGPQDEAGDDQPDDGIGDRQSESDERCADDDPCADVAIGSRMMAVRDQGRAVESTPAPPPDDRGDLVADDSHDSGQEECAEMGRRACLEKLGDDVLEGKQGAGEDDADHGVAGPAFGSAAAQDERGAERDRGEGVPAVVDHIGQESDAAAGSEDEELRHGCAQQDSKAQRDGLDTGPGPDDGRVHEAVRMTVRVRVLIMVIVSAPGSRGVVVVGGVRHHLSVCVFTQIRKLT
jgi:hypothetical protein